VILSCYIIFQFHMPLNEIERRTLWVSVWHSDMFGRNDFLGEVMLPMAGQIANEDSSPKWYSLQERVSESLFRILKGSNLIN
jgi:hypothetical protein